jgi:hypothetical protein
VGGGVVTDLGGLAASLHRRGIDWLAAPTTLVYSFEPPDGLAVGHDIVDVDGIYFRRYSYENRVGRPHTAAVVLARRMQRFEPRPNVLSPLVIRITIVVAVVAIVLLYFGTMRDRAAATVARRSRLQRQKQLARKALEERSAAAQEGSPKGDDPAPSADSPSDDTPPEGRPPDTPQPPPPPGGAPS